LLPPSSGRSLYQTTQRTTQQIVIFILILKSQNILFRFFLFSFVFFVAPINHRRQNKMGACRKSTGNGNNFHEVLPSKVYWFKKKSSSSSSSSVALQPRSGLGLPYLASLTGFMIDSSMWVISSTIDLVLHTLIQPSETSSSNYQRL
jgi:hypothetical protein